MTVCLFRPSTTRRLAVTVVGLALAATACADVGNGTVTRNDATGAATICQSIRGAMETDKKAADAATAAGNDAEAKRKMEAVIAGAQGARSVDNCDVSDIVPASAVPALPSDESAPSPSASPSP
ncbi:MAG: hypothetical protein ABIO67_11245 [Mycobacteriales bacterium]